MRRRLRYTDRYACQARTVAGGSLLSSVSIKPQIIYLCVCMYIAKHSALIDTLLYQHIYRCRISDRYLVGLYYLVLSIYVTPQDSYFL